MDVEIKFLRIERDKLRDEVDRLTAEKSEAIQAFAERVREENRLLAKVEQLEGALFGSNGALTRMDRARKILNDRHGFDNWNVLNTDDIKAVLKGDT